MANFNQANLILNNEQANVYKGPEPYSYTVELFGEPFKGVYYMNTDTLSELKITNNIYDENGERLQLGINRAGRAINDRIRQNIKKAQDNDTTILVNIGDTLRTINDVQVKRDEFANRVKELDNFIDNHAGKAEPHLKRERLFRRNQVKAIDSGGQLASFKNAQGNEYTEVPDFRGISTSHILFEDNILEAPVPPYVPFADTYNLYRNKFIIDTVKVNEDTYLVATADYKKRIKDVQEGKIAEEAYNCYALLTLDQLILSLEYYYQYVKAQFKKEAEDKGLRKPRRVSFGMGGNRLPLSFQSMYQHFVNPYAIGIGGYANTEVFYFYEEFITNVKLKRNDIDTQRKELKETYQKGFETAFGIKNTYDTIQSKYGVLVKRQNGDAITQDEITDIEQGLKLIYKLIANLTTEASNRQFKISHSADKMMFARKAVGLFIPSYNTIGVSAIGGKQAFHTVMAHEFGHFIDHILGYNRGYRYMTDNYDSKAGRIAVLVRQNMEGGHDSKYLMRTKECFARAIEQYFGIEVYGPEAGSEGNEQGINVEAPYVNQRGYLSYDNYKNKLKPAVEDFIESCRPYLETNEDQEKRENLPSVAEMNPELPKDGPKVKSSAKNPLKNEKNDEAIGIELKKGQPKEQKNPQPAKTPPVPKEASVETLEAIQADIEKFKKENQKHLHQDSWHPKSNAPKAVQEKFAHLYKRLNDWYQENVNYDAKPGEFAQSLLDEDKKDTNTQSDLKTILQQITDDPKVIGRMEKTLKKPSSYKGAKFDTAAQFIEMAVLEWGYKPETINQFNQAEYNKDKAKYDELKKSYPIGNPDHPDTKEKKRLEKKLEDRSNYRTKTTYVLRTDDTGVVPITKYGYQYAQQLLKSLNNKPNQDTDTQAQARARLRLRKRKKEK